MEVTNELVQLFNQIHVFVFLCHFNFYHGGGEQGYFNREGKSFKVTRITHPDYTAGNQFLNKMSPWNPDYSRILLLESGGSIPHPVTKTRAQGYCWGYLRTSQAGRQKRNMRRRENPSDPGLD